MPEVKKESQNVTESKKVDVLDRIHSVTNYSLDNLNFSIYGKPKTGKTTLLSTFPKPLLIIGAEDGTRSISNVPNVDFVKIHKSHEIEKLLPYARKKGYKSVGLDTATALEDMILAEIMGWNEVPVQKMTKGVRTEHWQERSAKVKSLMNAVFEWKGVSCILCHEKDFTKTDVRDSDLITPTIGSALGEQTTNWLNGKADYVCQTFIRLKKEIVEVVEGEKEEVVTDKPEYCLRIGAHPVYTTGFRAPRGAKMPEAVVNPTYNKLIQIIEGKFGLTVEQKPK